MEVSEEDMEVQEETVKTNSSSTPILHKILKLSFFIDFFL